MTKKDYIIIVKCMNETYNSLVTDLCLEPGHEKEMHYAYVVQQLLGKMFDAFLLDNPKFDWQRFKEAVYKK